MLGDFPVADHHNLVGQVNDALLVGDDDQRGLPLLVDGPEGLGQLGEGPQVDARLRLIKDHQPRLAGQNRGDLNALDLAAGQGGVHLPVDIVGGAQAHPGQILAALLPGQLLAARGQGQQIPHPQALEAGRLLKAVAHPQAGPLGDVQAGDVGAIPGDGAPGGPHQAHDGLRQGGLAAPVGAGDDHKLMVSYGEGDVVEDTQLLAGLPLHLVAEMLYLQHTRSLLCTMLLLMRCYFITAGGKIQPCRAQKPHYSHRIR